MNEITQEETVNQPENSGVAPIDKLLPQHQVNALIGAAKQKGYERGRQDTMAELQSQQAQSQPQIPNNQAPNSLDLDSIRRIAQEEFLRNQQEYQRKAQEEALRQSDIRVANELNAKMEDAKNRIQDFDKTIPNPNDIYSKIPRDILYAVNSFPNGGDMLHELVKNPEKIGTLQTIHPDFAMAKLKSLSDSITQNQMSLHQPSSPEPLSQVKPSTIGLDGSRKNLSVSDLMSDPRYRG